MGQDNFTVYPSLIRSAALISQCEEGAAASGAAIYAEEKLIVTCIFRIQTAIPIVDGSGLG